MPQTHNTIATAPLLTVSDMVAVVYIVLAALLLLTATLYKLYIWLLMAMAMYMASNVLNGS